MNFKDYYTTIELANILGVSQTTILKAIHEGKIEARKTWGGHYRIPVEEVEKAERHFVSQGTINHSPLKKGA